MSTQPATVLESREIRRRILALLGQMQELAGEIEGLLYEDRPEQEDRDGGS